MAAEDRPYLVADSAFYGADNLEKLSGVKWVTRVPATITEAKALLATIGSEQMQAASPEGYFMIDTAGDVCSHRAALLSAEEHPRTGASQW